MMKVLVKELVQSTDLFEARTPLMGCLIMQQRRKTAKQETTQQKCCWWWPMGFGAQIGNCFCPLDSLDDGVCEATPDAASGLDKSCTSAPLQAWLLYEPSGEQSRTWNFEFWVLNAIHSMIQDNITVNIIRIIRIKPIQLWQESRVKSQGKEFEIPQSCEVKSFSRHFWITRSCLRISIFNFWLSTFNLIEWRIEQV